MHAVIRAYNGNSALADALVEHADEVRQVISGIDGFKAYYVLKLAEGTSAVSVFENRDGADESSRAAAAWLSEGDTLYSSMRLRKNSTVRTLRSLSKVPSARWLSRGTTSPPLFHSHMTQPGIQFVNT